MPRSLMIFGDSNTFGSTPDGSPLARRRYRPRDRWTRIAAARLDGWEVRVDGLPGRTTQFDDPVMGANMNGQIALRELLRTPGAIDLLAIMLGTNDFKARFNPSPQKVADGIVALVEIALVPDVQARHGGFEVLVICPPPIREMAANRPAFLGAEPPSAALAPALEARCTKMGVSFFDAGRTIATSDHDGVHFDPQAHRKLGRAVAQVVKAL